jgi:hypothetical protein
MFRPSGSKVRNFGALKLSALAGASRGGGCKLLTPHCTTATGAYEPPVKSRKYGIAERTRLSNRTSYLQIHTIARPYFFRHIKHSYNQQVIASVSGCQSSVRASLQVPVFSEGQFSVSASAGLMRQVQG